MTIKAEKLRLLVTKECPRKCPGCCNNDWDLENLPTISSGDQLVGYKEVLLTGGEPLHGIHIQTIVNILRKVRKFNPEAKVYVYTAEALGAWVALIAGVDGITLTLHHTNDATDREFLFLNSCLRNNYKNITTNKSMRLNIFKEVEFDRSLLAPQWIVKDDMEWIENCPLPEGETFAKWSEK